MVKSDVSLRSLGFTTIAVDKPLRADINAIAASKGLTAAEYLRLKVAEDKSANPQGIIPSLSTHKNDIANSIKSIEAKVNRILAYELISKADVARFMSEDSTDMVEITNYAKSAVAGWTDEVKNAFRRVLEVSSGQGEMPVT